MTYAFDHDYPPGGWTAEELESSVRGQPKELPIPRFEAEDTWTRYAEESQTEQAVARLLSDAMEEADTSTTPFSASAYLQWVDGGEGSREWNDALNERLRRVWTFTMAECIEREGSYLDELRDDVWELCHLPTWSYPHELEDRGSQLRNGLPTDVPPEDRYIGLGATGVARRLAETVYCIGDELNPTVVQRAREEVTRRVIRPFEIRDDVWWMTASSHNITSVCASRAALSALALDLEPGRLTAVVLDAVEMLERYLQGFDPRGCWPEGVGYWSFGFGPYVNFAHHLRTRTDGAFSLLSPPIVEEIAQFPLRVELSRNHVVPFADSGEETSLSPYLSCWLGRQLGLEGLAARGREEFDRRQTYEGRYGGKGLEAVGRVPTDWTVPDQTLREYFPGCEWWVARADPGDPDTVAVAAKAGHNGHSHNHNDGGSFVVHVGGESLLTDLGSGAYDGAYFDDEHRYKYVAARSLGHSVPYPNGFEQAAGETYAAAVRERSETEDVDAIGIEISGCYPSEAGLDTLRRDIALDRSSTPPRITLEDVAEFRPGVPDNAIQSVLISRAAFEETADGLRVDGESASVTVRLRDGAELASVEHVERRRQPDDSYDGDGEKPIDAWRARVRPDPSRSGRRQAVRMTIEPDRGGVG